MRKKLLLLAASIAAGALLTTGISLAYYTDAEQAVNVVTTGNVRIQLSEAVPVPGTDEVWKVAEKKNQDGEVIGLEYQNILPGASVGKHPVITNVGMNDAYIRANITVKVTAKSGETLSADGIQFWKNGVRVVPVDGYFYADQILKVGEGENKESTSFFDRVTFPKTWGNQYAGANIEINMIAEAIQSDHIDVGSAAGEEAAKRAFTDVTIEESHKKLK